MSKCIHFIQQMRKKMGKSLTGRTIKWFVLIWKRDVLVKPAESISWHKEQLRGRCLWRGTEFSRTHTSEQWSVSTHVPAREAQLLLPPLSASFLTEHCTSLSDSLVSSHCGCCTNWWYVFINQPHLLALGLKALFDHCSSHPFIQRWHDTVACTVSSGLCPS